MAACAIASASVETRSAVGAERQRVGALVGRAAHDGHVRAEAGGELDRHVAETAQADHADAAARADVPGAQGRIGGDARAQQRGRPGEVEAVGHAQDEFLRGPPRCLE